MSIYLGENLLAGSFKSGASWEVGDVGISALGIDESLNKRRYLNGQVISQTQFVQFTAFLKSRVSVYPSLATTEVNWQAAVTNSDLGQCGKFVIDDVAGTIRLPKVVNIQGLFDLTGLGTTVEAGLPNITGTVQRNDNQGMVYSATGVSGAFKTSGNYNIGIQSLSENGWKSLEFDASRSSSIYGNSTTVQQEAVQYPYFIQVAEGIENSVDVSREIELNNPFSLLDYKYSEYELSNASWLRSNGQYNSGATYSAVYNLLLAIYNGTETKAGVSVKLSTETYADTDFVLNTSDTTFRLPIKVLMAGSKRVAGNGISLGLTDGTNYASLYSHNGGNYGIAFSSDTGRYGGNVGDTGYYSPLPDAKLAGVTTDETKSGIETSANGLYLYFYVGETVQDANIIAAASVLTKVANSIDRTVESDRETVIGWGMPDYTAGTSYTIGSNFTPTKNGFFIGSIRNSKNNATNYITFSCNGTQVYSAEGTTANGNIIPFIQPLAKGNTYNLSVTQNDAYSVIKFYPCLGEN